MTLKSQNQQEMMLNQDPLFISSWTIKNLLHLFVKVHNFIELMIYVFKYNIKWMYKYRSCNNEYFI